MLAPSLLFADLMSDYYSDDDRDYGYDDDPAWAGAPAPRTSGTPGKSTPISRLGGINMHQLETMVMRVLRKADGREVTAPAEASIARAQQSSGQPLPRDLRAQFAQSLGYDLDAVRVHTGADAADSAGAVGARAYTLGNDIHFGDGHYDPTSADGQRLIAHEVVHTVQQAGGSGGSDAQFKLEVSQPGDALEQEADDLAERMVSGQRGVVSTLSGPTVARWSDEDMDHQIDESPPEQQRDPRPYTPARSSLSVALATARGVSSVAAADQLLAALISRHPNGGPVANVDTQDIEGMPPTLSVDELEQVILAVNRRRDQLVADAAPTDGLAEALGEDGAREVQEMMRQYYMGRVADVEAACAAGERLGELVRNGRGEIPHDTGITLGHLAQMIAAGIQDWQLQNTPSIGAADPNVRPGAPGPRGPNMATIDALTGGPFAALFYLIAVFRGLSVEDRDNAAQVGAGIDAVMLLAGGLASHRQSRSAPRSIPESTAPAPTVLRRGSQPRNPVPPEPPPIDVGPQQRRQRNRQWRSDQRQRGQQDRARQRQRQRQRDMRQRDMRRSNMRRRGARFKLETSEPGDAHEVEADRVADAMVAGHSASVNISAGHSVQRVLSDARASQFRVVYESVGTTEQVIRAIIEFENRRRPNAAYSMDSASEDARPHAQQVPEVEGLRNRRLEALPMDDPQYNDHSVASINPLDPDHPDEVLHGDQEGTDNGSLRQVFSQHRDNNVGQQFGGATTAVVLAARDLAEQAATSVPGAAGVAELIRRRLFAANEYATVDTLNPQNSRRYQPGAQTFCNIYVMDALRAMGVPEEALPTYRHAATEDRGEALTNSTGGSANATAGMFLRPPLNTYWADLGTNADQAQAEADQGHVVICAGTSHSRAGHYSLVMAQNQARGVEAQPGSPVESNAGGGRPATAEGRPRTGSPPADSAPEDRYHTANWNYESRQSRTDRGAPHGRSIQWWSHGHDGHFLVYRGGGASNNAAERSTYRLESERSMGMDYERPVSE